MRAMVSPSMGYGCVVMGVGETTEDAIRDASGWISKTILHRTMSLHIVALDEGQLARIKAGERSCKALGLPIFRSGEYSPGMVTI